MDLSISPLSALALRHGSDKWGVHSYTTHYEFHFARLRDKPLKLFEIGVGGYDDPLAGGGSLRMWRDYFVQGEICTLDYFDKSAHAEERVKVYRGDQSDEEILRKINAEAGPFDIIIDDGSHENAHVLKSFSVLFPLLKAGGIYVIEDCQTSYWPHLGGDATNFDNPSTSVGFIKTRVDGLNHKEIAKENPQPNYYDQNIISIHFYHNIIFIYKGDNTEESNILHRNKFPPHLEHFMTPRSDYPG
jgi:demethylmacrocin O-methyltransferase